jgi:uroporphyrinogen-III synthase
LLTLEPLVGDKQPAVPELAPGDLVLFVSANAVALGLPALKETILRHNVLCLGVGQRTLTALEEAGVSGLAPQREDSEGLLALPALQNVAGRQVVLVKGEGGRELLSATLTARGATVVSFYCYKREPVTVPCDIWRQRLMAAGEVVFHANSGDTLQALSALLERCNMVQYKDAPVVVPSERVALLAEQLGWSRVWCTNNASDDALIALLHEKWPHTDNGPHDA